MKFTNLKKFLPLLIIILLAAFLRFFQLGINPPSLTWDEVAWGYNAYSLGIDGRDEFGQFLPYKYLESFGDFKPPVYAYLDILPIKIFGLNEFATRFPSALFGTMSVLMTYLVTKKIFEKNKSTLEIGNWKVDIPLITAALLAISPWHIMLSRAAFEANVASFFLISAVYCFLESLGRRRYFLILSAVCFVIPIYTFNSARVAGPLLAIALVLGNWQKLWNIKKIAILAGIIGVILLLPTAKFLLSPQAKLRFQEVNIFTDSNVVKMSNQEIANDHNAAISKIIHNRRVLFSFDFLQHYFDNLSSNFLFITGDGNPKFSVRNIGQLYLWEIPFLPLGLLFLFKKREGYWWLIPLWLMLAIIPAATARETPHALRIEGTLPTFQILVAYGVVNTLTFILSFSRTRESRRYKQLNRFLPTTIVICYLFFVFFNFTSYLHEYYTNYAMFYSGEWQYGYVDAINYMQQQYSNYDKLYLTGALGRPYIYTLFYTHYAPQKFRSTADIQRDSFGFVHVKGFDKYVFGENPADSNQKMLKASKTLYIDTPQNTPLTAKKLKTFYLKDGNPVLNAYTL
jgi:4-amino-4-deoxy-L-arabinose transferase-like glycosyltransferase